MKKSMCCNEDMIYLGKCKSPVLAFIDTYHYCCYKCGKLEWSTDKEKCKYKWYKEKDRLTNLFKSEVE